MNDVDMTDNDLDYLGRRVRELLVYNCEGLRNALPRYLAAGNVKHHS